MFLLNSHILELVAFQKRWRARKYQSSWIFSSEYTTHLSMFGHDISYGTSKARCENTLPIYWHVQFSYTFEKSRAPRFRSSNTFSNKQPSWLDVPFISTIALINISVDDISLSCVNITIYLYSNNAFRFSKFSESILTSLEPMNILTQCIRVASYSVRDWTKVIQAMAWRLFGAKPLPEPMLTDWQFNPHKQSLV